MYTDKEAALATRSLKDRVKARLTHLDLGTYDFDWLDSRKVSEIAFQLQWLDDAAAECRVDGDLDSAEAYEEVLEVIQIESQLAAMAAAPKLYAIDPHGPLDPDYEAIARVWDREAMKSHAEVLARLEEAMNKRRSHPFLGERGHGKGGRTS